MAIIKYDTSGVFQWLRMPQNDTMTTSYANNNTRAWDMVVSKNGTLYVRCRLSAGLYDNGYLADSVSMHIWKYDKDGNFLGGFPLQTDGYGGLMARNPENGRFIWCGVNNLGSEVIKVGSDSIIHNNYVVCFDSNGNYQWKRENGPYYTVGFSGRPSLDHAGNIIVGGSTNNLDTFASYLFTNVINSLSASMPFIVKLDGDGNLLWANNASSTASCRGGPAVLTGTHAYVQHTHVGTFTWNSSTDTFYHFGTSPGYDIGLTSFSSTAGTYAQMNTLASGAGYNEFPSAITKDHKGNIYIGGEFEGNLYVAGDTLNSNGGYSDFFVVKYGYANCDCTTPEPLFTFSSGPVISFSYTGTTDLDSLHWDFGDGSSSAATNPTHTYATSGSYNVCVTAYNACGSNTACQLVTASVSAGSVAALFPGVAVYPNPTKDLLYIKGAAAGTTVVLYTNMGQVAAQRNGSGSLSLKSLPAGIYLLQLTGKEGQRAGVRVVKE